MARTSDVLRAEEKGQKSDRIAVRLTPAAKRTLERAADLAGRSLSDFVVASALGAAQRTIEERERFRLADQDRTVFLSALASPPAPNKALRAAAQRYRQRQGA